MTPTNSPQAISATTLNNLKSPDILTAPNGLLHP